MKRSKTISIILLILVVVFFAIVVPVLINESYKTNSGYLTEWGASDVLGYYGTILGAVVTIIALIVTIRFTKRQIQHDRFLKEQKEKWDKIEALVYNAIEDIHPSKLSEIISQCKVDDLSASLREIHTYTFRAKTALDSLFGYLSGTDYKKLEPLLNSVSDSADKYCNVALELNKQYMRLMQLEMRKNAENIMQTINTNPNVFDSKEVDRFKNIIESTGNVSKDAIMTELERINNHLVALREKDYRKLLEKKRETFTAIYDGVNEEADSILHLWRK